MSVTILPLTPRDPIIARDGRPFGAGQGNKMRGLPWPLPSVVAGSFRTALVKASDSLTFDKEMPTKLLQIEVGGVFPVHNGELYLPAPNDAVAEPTADGKGIKIVHRVTPQLNDRGCDFPDDLPLKPVMLAEGIKDFKPVDTPAWWPLSGYANWLTSNQSQLPSNLFTPDFLNAPIQDY